ncbi:tannase/feruloyl esterase family alpha/beta hydrolase [Parahaliea maris]|uniref:tannase/feruloyl esterase family alpha/beta hydrolase n=1 Tax=Parahaliea maris TaxID=2716870 RepID=UPI00165088EB|nr:tannase/feruloyl esterase family alpha/beta hydrolase [Parahaliea maris]
MPDELSAQGLAQVESELVNTGPTGGRSYCVLTASIDNSPLRFNVWLPTSDWNGKLAFIGGGGFDGELLDDAFKLVLSPSILEEHYALASSNGGHDKPDSLNPLAYFRAEFARDPEMLADFMYRSEHRVLPHALTVVEEWFGQIPTHSYFEGCSMGGHDALILAQRYPDDFDGIIARAPAGNILGLFLQFNRIGSLIRNGDLALDKHQRQLLQEAVLAHCDASDGLDDNIISLPQYCDFDPAVLACSEDGNDGRNCLQARQVKLLRAITTPYTLPDSTLQHPGYLYGGENSDKGWGEYIWPNLTGYSIQMLFSEGFVRSFVTGDESTDTWNWNPGNYLPRLLELEQQFNAFDPNLAPLHEGGGKLILWNGLQDTSVSPLDTIAYFNAVSKSIGSKVAEETVELFLAPGVGHCWGGTGADEVDLMAALDRWVEHGIAPSQQQLVARKAGSEDEEKLSRPLCKYPRFASYVGEGDPADASNFTCEMPPR